MSKARTKTEDVDRRIYLAFIELLSLKEKITPLKIIELSKVSKSSLYNRMDNFKLKIGDFKNG